MKPFTTKPKAKTDSIVSGKNYRFTILTEALLRYEWAEDGKFEDRASTFAINRDLPVPEYRVIDKGDDGLEIITSRFHLSYDKKRFSSSGLQVDVKGRLTLWGAQWQYGDFSGTLGGTARTLDEADGRIPMGVGVCSRIGYACIDDSTSMLFDGDGWVAGRRSGDRDDGYVFCYGHDYKDAIKAYYKLSGSQPLLPRWALGNWWSRYHAYSSEEYLGLMDRFREEGIPLSVGVVDMDWHLVDDERVTHTGWTGYTWDDKYVLSMTTAACDCWLIPCTDSFQTLRLLVKRCTREISRSRSMIILTPASTLLRTHMKKWRRRSVSIPRTRTQCCLIRPTKNSLKLGSTSFIGMWKKLRAISGGKIDPERYQFVS